MVVRTMEANMETKIIGKNILSLRKEKKITQEELAKLASVSRNYISMIERGKVENISEDIIRKLAWGLETSLEQLTGKPNDRSGTVIPPGLREFAIKEGLPFETVDALLQIPFRGKEPKTANDWKSFYDVIKDFISGS